MTLQRRAKGVKLLPSLLAAGWVYIAARVAQGAGGLLPHRFTLTIRNYTPKERSPFGCVDTGSASAAGPRHWCRFGGHVRWKHTMPLSTRFQMAVCFLLHCPSPCGGRPLDGTLLHCSPDFPLGMRQASIRRALYFILANFKKKRKRRQTGAEAPGKRGWISRVSGARYPSFPSLRGHISCRARTP